MNNLENYLKFFQGHFHQVYLPNSVTNTAKRALLIWTSVLIFHNQVTIPSAVGTATVIVGVFLYQQALTFESKAASTSMAAESPTSSPYIKPP